MVPSASYYPLFAKLSRSQSLICSPKGVISYSLVFLWLFFESPPVFPHPFLNCGYCAKYRGNATFLCQTGQRITSCSSVTYCLPRAVLSHPLPRPAVIPCIPWLHSWAFCPSFSHLGVPCFKLATHLSCLHCPQRKTGIGQRRFIPF